MAVLSRPAPGFGRGRGRVGGVCAALARRFGINVKWLRLGFVVSMVLPGPQVLLYAFLWWLIPEDER